MSVPNHPFEEPSERTSSSHVDGESAGGASKSRAVLLVDDEDIVMNVTIRMLEAANWRVISASSGQEAIALFKKHSDQIDVIVMDTLMPGMDGREAYERICRIRNNIPVVFCSGYTQDVLKSEYLLSIPGELLQKPYRAAELLEKIQRVMEMRELQVAHSHGSDSHS